MIYFDNAATGWPKPPEVFAAMKRCLEQEGGNPGRSGHRMAVAAETLLNAARNAAAKFFGLRDPDHCIFALNCTDALNMALKGILRPGDRVVSSVLEHNSINRPLQHLADEHGVEVRRANMTPEGAWRTDEVLSLVDAGTRMLALTHCSNVAGVVCPVEELGRALRERAEKNGKPPPLLLVDAAQTAGVVPLDLEAAGIDLLAMPGHKGLLGPPGTGMLLLGPRVSPDDFCEWREGGTGGNSAEPRQPREAPYYFEGGTPNTVGAAGLLAGLEFLAGRGPEEILRHERRLIARLIAGLRDDGRFTLSGTTDAERKVGVLSINIRGREPAELATLLDQAFGIAVRAGLHCAPLIHKAFGTFPAGAVRLSPGYFNTAEEVDAVLAALREIAG